MAQQETRDVIIRLQGGQALKSIKELEGASRSLRKEWRMASDDASRQKIAKELQQVNTKLAEQRALTTSVKSGWDKVSSTIMKMGGLMAGMMGFQMVTQQFSKMIERGAQLSDSLTDVQKVTGFTSGEMTKLQKNLKQMDTRTARKELLELSWAAGKLGLKGVEDVTAFVRAGDKIKVALGKDLGADAIQQIGKLVKVFKVDEKFGLEDGMIRVGSTINKLGMESIAAEGFLVEFTKRLAGISGVADIPIQDNLALAATLDNLGQTAETSSTALSKMFIKMASDAEGFAKMAQMGVAEWKQLLETDAVGALKVLLENVGQTSGGINGLAESLGDLGMDGGRVVGVLGALAKNTELLTAQQKISNDAFREGNSVLQEFDLKNRNMAANVEVLTKWLNTKLISSSFMKGLESMTSTMRDYITIPTSQKMREEQVEMNVLVGRIMELNEGSEERKKLLDELVKAHPKMLEGLDKETVSNGELAIKLKEVNEQLINRIIIQRKQEELDKQNEKVADAKMRQMDAEQKAREKVADAALKYGISIEGLATMEEKAEKVRQVLAEKVKNREHDTATDRERMKSAIGNINIAMRQWDYSEKQLSKRMEESNDILAERERLMKELGISPDAAPQMETGGIKPVSDYSEELSEKELKARQKKLDEFLRQTKDLEQQLMNIRIDAIADEEEREITKLENAHRRRQDEISALEADEQVKADLQVALADETERKVAELREKYARERVKAHEEAIRKEIDVANRSNLLNLELDVSLAQGPLEEVQARMRLLAEQVRQELEAIANDELLDPELRFKIEQDLALRLQQLWADYEENRRNEAQQSIEQQIQLANDYISSVSQAVQQFTSGISNLYGNMMEVARQQKADEIKELEEQHAKGLISKEAYERKKADLDERAAKTERNLKRKQWAVDKVGRVTQGIQNVALAVTSAMTAGPIIGQVLAGVTAALGAIQVGMILGETNPYYKGGYTNVTDTEGNRYQAKNVGSIAGGGWYDEASYGIVGEKGREWVAPNWMVTSPEYSDTIAMLDAAVTRGYARGGMTSTAPKKTSATVSTSTSAQGGGVDMSGGQAEVLARLVAAIERLEANGVRGVWEWQNFVTGVFDQEEIENQRYFSGRSGRRPGEPI